VELVLIILLVGSFALFVTSHVALSFGLTLRRPRWRGPCALLVPPLAPYWGFEERMRVRSLLWLGALALYVVALTLSHWLPG
jgi:hypothetical protein